MIVARGDEERDAAPSPSAGSRVTMALRILTLAGMATGVICWALGFGVAALVCFCLASAAVVWVLPGPYAFVAPLYAGLVAWLVDMLPLLILIAWTSYTARWALDLWRRRRLPLGGRWIWIPIGLTFWTLAGILVVPFSDLKHFALLFGLQVLSGAAILAAAEMGRDPQARVRVVSGALAFVVILSVGALVEWVGVPVQSLQDSDVGNRIENAYGLDAFRNDTGMIKLARKRYAGALRYRRKLKAARTRHPGLPEATVYVPPFDAFERINLVVRFEGSAREYEDLLRKRGIYLLYDNVGLAPADTVARLRSFPRNALTYAGISAALFPLSFFLIWSGERRTRWLGWAAATGCLFGAAFSLARGAWVAVALGVVYLLVDGAIPLRRKLQVLGVAVAGALVLIGFYLIHYDIDPLTARAGGQGSINTRSSLYGDTVVSVGHSKLRLLVGAGTELARPGGGLGKYVPPAGTHSTYLNYLVRTGIPGMLAIMALYLLAGLHARAAARSTQGAERAWATLLAACVIVFGAHAAILSLFVEPIYTFTISLLVGLTLAYAGRLPRSILPWRSQPAP